MDFKKVLLALIFYLVLFPSSFCYSQLSIIGEDGTNISESVINIYLEPNVDFYSYQAQTINGYDTSITLNAKRIELTYINGTHEIFDWNCGLPPLEAGTESIFYSPSVFDIVFEAGDSSFSGLPSFLFWPYGNIGDALYRYVVYDVNNPNDSTWVDIHYYIGALNVEERNINPITISAYPNPADQFIVIELITSDPIIEIYSSIGVKMYSERIISNEAKHGIDLSLYPSGIYFIHEKKSAAVKKFIIAR